MTLETERLLLRQFAAQDLEMYTNRIFGDADVMRYLPKRDAPASERAQKTMDFFNDHWTQYSYGPWAVVEKASGELIGHCGLRFIPDIQETEVLYAFGKDFWTKGYATEAARASVDFGFNQVGLERIIALAVPENTASRKVMEHCGLQYEKETHLFGLDVVYYALNRADYSLSANNTHNTN
jgi:RimJ/RimL family protein N-acetyltransferase